MRKLHANFTKANELLEGNVSAYLDLARGISAILVVMEHLSSRLFVGYGNVEHQTALVKLLYLLNMLGSPSVIIFFVLSGLFISRSVLKSVFENKWSWRSYLINRLSRLYIVLLPALVITFVLDMISANRFGYERYANLYANLKDWVGNLFFLQNIFVGVYGSNAPLWSLNYEFWYYMLFPLVLLIVSYRQRKFSNLLYLLAVISIVSTIGIRMNSYFTIWLIGTLVMLLPRINMLARSFAPRLAFILVVAAMIVRPLVLTGRLFTKTWTENLYVVDLIIGLAFGFFIYAMIHNVPKSDKAAQSDIGRLGKIAKLLSGFSFSLYLIHYPIVNTLYFWSAANGFKGLQPGIVSILLEVLLVSLICFIAFVFSRMTEVRTPALRKLMERKARAFTIGRRHKTLNEQNVTS